MTGKKLRSMPTRLENHTRHGCVRTLLRTDKNLLSEDSVESKLNINLVVW